MFCSRFWVDGQGWGCPVDSALAGTVVCWALPKGPVWLEELGPELVEAAAGGGEPGLGGVGFSVEGLAGVSFPGGGLWSPLEFLGEPELAGVFVVPLGGDDEGKAVLVQDGTCTHFVGLFLDALLPGVAAVGGRGFGDEAATLVAAGSAGAGEATHPVEAGILGDDALVAGATGIGGLSAPLFEVTGLAVVVGVAFGTRGFGPVGEVLFVWVVVFDEVGDRLGAKVAFGLQGGLLGGNGRMTNGRMPTEAVGAN